MGERIDELRRRQIGQVLKGCRQRAAAIDEIVNSARRVDDIGGRIRWQQRRECWKREGQKDVGGVVAQRPLQRAESDRRIEGAGGGAALDRRQDRVFDAGRHGAATRNLHRGAAERGGVGHHSGGGRGRANDADHVQRGRFERETAPDDERAGRIERIARRQGAAKDLGIANRPGPPQSAAQEDIRHKRRCDRAVHLQCAGVQTVLLLVMLAVPAVLVLKKFSVPKALLLMVALPPFVPALKLSVPLLVIVAPPAVLVSAPPLVPKLVMLLLVMLALPAVLVLRKLRVPALLLVMVALLPLLPPSKIRSPLFVILAVPAVLVFSKTVPFRNA